jgi:hypothetical protein
MMRQLSGCKDGPCPKVFHDAKWDEYYIQGDNVADAPMTTIAPHERLVRVPGTIMREAVAAMQAGI